MEIKKIQALIKYADQFQDEIKEAEDALKEELAPKKKKLEQIKEKLAEFIHKEDDGVQSVKLPDGSALAYAMYTDTYKMKDWQQFKKEFILDGIPAKYAKILDDRLDGFTKSYKKDEFIDYRKQTGAEEKNKRLVGGDLPPGTGLWVKKEVRIVKGDS